MLSLQFVEPDFFFNIKKCMNVKIKQSYLQEKFRSFIVDNQVVNQKLNKNYAKKSKTVCMIISTWRKILF